MSAFEFFTFMAGLLLLSHLLKRLERKLTRHRASYAQKSSRIVDTEGNDVTEFCNVMFANWSTDELAELSISADAWMPSE